MLRRIVLCAVVLCAPAIASAVTITIDDFENGNLAAWTAGSNGQIVVDPLDSSNHVLNFTALGDGGNIWTANTYAATGNDWWLSFDYLGTAPNSGGFIGWDTDTLYAGNEKWLAGTNPAGLFPDAVVLTDDSTWHHYVIHLTRGQDLAGAQPLPDAPVYIKAEDWYRGDSIAGDAYFDNLVITDVNPASAVPEPSTLALLAMGFGLLAAGARRGRSIVQDPRRQTRRA